MLFVDDVAEPRETPEHPLKQLKVSAGFQEAPRAGWSACHLSAARLPCINRNRRFRAEGLTLYRRTVEMLPLERSQVAGLSEWPSSPPWWWP